MNYLRFGTCPNCKKYNTGFLYCHSCDYQICQKWTSGNSEIDEFIKSSQINSKYYHKVIEFIPYNKLENVEQIGQGGFSTVYSATWIDGKRTYKLDTNINVLFSREPCTVALKSLTGIPNVPLGFFNEFKIHYECQLNRYSVDKYGIEIYGITYNSANSEYLMVHEYADKGDLRQYLSTNFKNLDWKQKIKIPCSISDNLDFIHQSYVHGDFHSRNILMISTKNIINIPYLIGYHITLSDSHPINSNFRFFNLSDRLAQIGNYRITGDGGLDLIGDKNGIQIIIGIFVVTNNINIKELTNINSTERKIIISHFNELEGYVEQMEQEHMIGMLKLSNDIYNAEDCIEDPNSTIKDLKNNLTILMSHLEKFIQLNLDFKNSPLLSNIVRNVALSKNLIIIAGAGIRSSNGLFEMIKQNYPGSFSSVRDLFDTNLHITDKAVKAFYNFMAQVVQLHGTLANLQCNVCTNVYSFTQEYCDIFTKEIATYDQDKADCLIIMGTSLRIHGVKCLIKKFAEAVHDRNGYVIMVNATNVVTKE
ncbi:5820_t:CDS:2 [Scutellospora calospora]|uniref:5820_t:CDS:1 n=1 Tax=Scutellospora calospora TaxID=85575 RepID=A0ACA9JVM0_9GLOM|nr:5820_t:CDS:2 [Scutellospora calospora]